MVSLDLQPEVFSDCDVTVYLIWASMSEPQTRRVRLKISLCVHACGPHTHSICIHDPI